MNFVSCTFVKSLALISLFSQATVCATNFERVWFAETRMHYLQGNGRLEQIGEKSELKALLTFRSVIMFRTASESIQCANFEGTINQVFGSMRSFFSRKFRYMAFLFTHRPMHDNVQPHDKCVCRMCRDAKEVEKHLSNI